MFGLLKKKITSFIDGLTKKEEQKPDEPEAEGLKKQGEATESAPKAVVQALEQKAPFSQTPEPKPSLPETSETKAIAAEKAAAPFQPEPQRAPPSSRPIVTPPQSALIPTSKGVTPQPPAQAPAPKPAETTPTQSREKPTPTQTPVESTKTTSTPTTRPVEPVSPPPAKTPFAEAPKERKLTAKLGILTQLKGLISRDVQIQPSELEPMLDELNMALLESDVTLDTADHFVATIKTQLSGKKVDKSRVQQEIQAAVKTALVEVLDKPALDLVDYIRQHEKPVKILFLGPNGAGKTTTLAKITHYLKQNDIRCVLAAADTFRAAAIEQLQHHGAALQVPVIKHQYGADPAAVAFDAIAHAKAHNLDVVLIDTAGRQETNYNLLKEMEKINRVVQPDLKLFIGEAVAGHALVEQAKTFHSALKLDGVILTKVDCDAKGGTSFSVSHEVGVPIVLLGTGQNYADLRPFDAAWLVSNVLAE